MKKKFLKQYGIIFLMIMISMTLAACTTASKTTEKKETASSVPATSEESSPLEKKQYEIGAEDMDALCGMWILVAYENENGYYMVGDEADSLDSRICIYREEDRIYADYHYSQYYTEDINGMTVISAENHDLSAMSGGNPDVIFQNRWDETITRTAALVGENELLYCEKYTDTEDGYTVRCTYLREDSEELANADELRYSETVTVATVEELARAIKSRTKIILKEGVYNFSELNFNEEEAFNLHVEDEGVYDMGREYAITDVSDLCLEAEEGAEVTILTENPYAAVLNFYSCRNIVLRGLTCGHQVEPGLCGGSVICACDSENLAIDNCYLYGSGTYGVEMYNVCELMVSDTEIYDCTYGLVFLSMVSYAEFRECRLYDSREFSMFEISDCFSILFDSCEVSGNVSDADYSSFINNRESYGITFRDCSFHGNTYDYFVNEVGEDEYGEAVSFENCTEDGRNL